MSVARPDDWTVARFLACASTSAGVLRRHRTGADDPWTAVALTAADVLALPEIGAEIRVAEL